MSEYKTTLQRQQDRLLDYVNLYRDEVSELRSLVASHILTEGNASEVMNRYDELRAKL